MKKSLLGLVAAGVLCVTLGMTWAADSKSAGQGNAGQQQAAVLDSRADAKSGWIERHFKDGRPENTTVK